MEKGLSLAASFPPAFSAAFVSLLRPLPRLRGHGRLVRCALEGTAARYAHSVEVHYERGVLHRCCCSHRGAPLHRECVTSSTHRSSGHEPVAEGFPACRGLDLNRAGEQRAVVTDDPNLDRRSGESCAERGCGWATTSYLNQIEPRDGRKRRIGCRDGPPPDVVALSTNGVCRCLASHGTGEPKPRHRNDGKDTKRDGCPSRHLFDLRLVEPLRWVTSFGSGISGPSLFGERHTVAWAPFLGQRAPLPIEISRGRLAQAPWRPRADA
jgi:hypothetical protein